MSTTNNGSREDPYQALAQSLQRGDVVNRWLLAGPRKRIVQVVKGQRVLDVACGTGNLTAMLAAAGCEAVGVDSSPTMLSFAQRKHIPAEFRQADATHLPFEREFDAAVISIALHEMPPAAREETWASMRRAVRPQGRLIALDVAVPRSVGLVTRIARSLTEQDERRFLTIHREHYENFMQFMQNGGLRGWIQERGDPVEAEYDYWGGTLAVVVCRRLESGQASLPHASNARSVFVILSCLGESAPIQSTVSRPGLGSARRSLSSLLDAGTCNARTVTSNIPRTRKSASAKMPREAR